MFFLCKDVNVYNYEYHYHPASQPKRTEKRFSSKIKSISNEQQRKNMQESGSKENKNNDITLLQKVRRKIEDLDTSLYATTKKKIQPKLKQLYGTKESQLQNFHVDKNKTQNLSSINSSQTTRELPQFNFSLQKQILISHTFNDQISDTLGENYIIEEESSLILPAMGGKFVFLRTTFSNSACTEHIAYDISMGMLVSIKAMPLKQDTGVELEKKLKVYSKIGIHPLILDLYKIFLHGTHIIMVKQPYSKVTPTINDKQNLAKDITNALKYFQKIGVFVGPLKMEDIRGCLGVWKIANIENIYSYQFMPIKDNILQLLAQIKKEN